MIDNILDNEVTLSPLNKRTASEWLQGGEINETDKVYTHTHTQLKQGGSRFPGREDGYSPLGCRSQVTMSVFIIIST